MIKLIRWRFFVAAVVSITFLLLGGCSCETSTSFGLTIDDSSFATKRADGKLSLIDDGVYKRGETVYFVLRNVGPFKKGGDGLNRFDMDMEFRDPEGETLLSEKGVLGEKGHVNLPDNIAPSPYVIVRTTPKMKAGKHKVKVIVYDKVGNGSASKGSTLILK